jgi:hypothetical protein
MLFGLKHLFVRCRVPFRVQPPRCVQADALDAASRTVASSAVGDSSQSGSTKFTSVCPICQSTELIIEKQGSRNVG